MYDKRLKVFSLKKKRFLDISLQYKNKASYKFSKKKLLHLAEKRAGAERVNPRIQELSSLAPNTKFSNFAY